MYVKAEHSLSVFWDQVKMFLYFCTEINRPQNRRIRFRFILMGPIQFNTISEDQIWTPGANPTNSEFTTTYYNASVGVYVYVCRLERFFHNT
jgi:hypothetical protein